MNIRKFIQASINFLKELSPATENTIDDVLVLAIENNTYLVELAIRFLERRLNAEPDVLQVVSHDEGFQLTAQGVDVEKWIAIMNQLLALYRALRG